MTIKKTKEKSEMRREEKKKETLILMHNDEWSLDWSQWIMHKSHACTFICVFFLLVPQKERERGKKREREEKKRMSTDFSLALYYWLIGEFYFLHMCFVIVSNQFSSSNEKTKRIHRFEQFIHLKRKICTKYSQSYRWCKRMSFLLQYSIESLLSSWVLEH